MKASHSRRARQSGGRAVDQVERVRADGASLSLAFAKFIASALSMPRPAGASAEEHVAYTQNVGAYGKEILGLLEMLAEDVSRHCARGQS